jgi:hypothetical protein
MMKYRVKYPLITMDGQRDFDTREQAEAFAASQRCDPRSIRVRAGAGQMYGPMRWLIEPPPR